jgi:hypothetical protein
MTKSHVAMGYATCPICLTDHTQTVLLDRRMKDTFEHKAYRYGFELCQEHQRLYDEGYIALVGVDTDQKRTGEICHIRKTVFEQMFKPMKEAPMFFCDQEVIEQIKLRSQDD